MSQRSIETGLATAIRERKASALTLLAMGGAIVMDDPRRAENPLERGVRVLRLSLKAMSAR